MELEQHGFDGSQLRALVFLLIAITVLFSGLTSGWVAGLLGLRRQRDVGWVILSVNGVSRALARILIQGGEEVICIAENPKACRLAEEDCIRAIYGNGLDERILLRAEVDTRLGVIGLSRNEEVNLLFAKRAQEVCKLGRVLVGLSSADTGITEEMIGNMGGRIFSGRPFDIEQWESWFNRGLVVL